MNSLARIGVGTVAAVASLAGVGATTAQAATRAVPTAPHAVRGWNGTPKAHPVIDTRCITKGTAVCVNKTAHRLYLVKDGKVVDDFSVRTGRASLPTREGLFHVQWKDANSWSHLYHVSMPYSMYFSGGEAIHYSADFATYGYSHGGSHGCVNLRDKAGAKMLFSVVKVGDPVVVYH